MVLILSVFSYIALRGNLELLTTCCGIAAGAESAFADVDTINQQCQASKIRKGTCRFFNQVQQFFNSR
jgi:hypothetical protein